MIQEFVDRFMQGQGKLREIFSDHHPETYEDLVKEVVTILHNPDECNSIDPARIHTIDDGDYQGTLLFVIAASNYQPFDYWYVFVGYGSCSGCDTLQSIRDYADEKPTNAQVKDYMRLALHIVQGLKKMDESEII